jgi:hypothetical protein
VSIGGQGPFNGKPMSPQAIQHLVDTSNNEQEAVAKFKAMAQLSQQGHLDLGALQQSQTSLKFSTTGGSVSAAQSLEFHKGMKQTDIAKLLQKYPKPLGGK